MVIAQPIYLLNQGVNGHTTRAPQEVPPTHPSNLKSRTQNLWILALALAPSLSLLHANTDTSHRHGYRRRRARARAHIHTSQTHKHPIAGRRARDSAYWLVQPASWPRAAGHVHRRRPTCQRAAARSHRYWRPSMEAGSPGPSQPGLKLKSAPRAVPAMGKQTRWTTFCLEPLPRF